MEKIGEGNTAEVYRLGGGRACKLFFDDYPQEAIRNEYKNAKLMYKLGVPMPAVFELVTIDERMGIVYRRLHGKTLLQKYREDGDLDYLLHSLVQCQKTILDISDTASRSYKTFLLQFFPDEESQIRALPMGDCLCHGDLHPDNIFVTKEGELQVIDFMNVCHGPREYDIARTYFFLSLEGDQKFLHQYLEEMGADLEDLKPLIDYVRRTHKIEMGE